MRPVWAAASICVVLTTAPAALASPPRLDRGFGTDGVSRTTLPPRSKVERFGEIAPTADGGFAARSSYFEGTEVRHYGPDGAMVSAEPEADGGPILRPPEAITADSGKVVGIRLTGGSGAVSRYRPDDSLDTSFGSGGTSERVPFQVEAIAALPSGAVLVAGSGILRPGGTRSEATHQVYVARLGADGKIDQSFGRSGIVKLHSEDSVEGADALDIQGRSDEGVEVVTEFEAVALARSGGLDPSFADGGRLTLPGQVLGAATAPDEKFLIAGSKPALPEGEEESLYAARYTAAGKLDPTYGGGAGINSFEAAETATAGAVLFGTDGSVSVGGFLARRKNCPPDLTCDATPAAVRFTPDGSADAGFGRDGIVRLTTLTVPVQSDYVSGVEALVPRADGGFFASGTGLGGGFVAAVGADGYLDTGFGGDGLITAEEQNTSYATPSATGVDRAGDVYALVQSNSGTGLTEGSFVLRYSPDGRLDRRFGEDGRAYVPPFSEGLVVAPDGSSYVTSAESSTLVKLKRSGSLAASFGKEGSVEFPEGEAFDPGAMVTLADGDLLVGGGLTGRAGASAAVLRYRPDGELDRSFGEGGVALANRRLPWTWRSTNAIAVDAHGRILVAGGEFRSCCRESGALVRFGPDGHLDRSFGRGGRERVGKHLPAFYGLALRDGHIFTAATDRLERADRELIYSFRSDGSLDRTFGNRGVATAPTRYTGYGNAEPTAVVVSSRRIFLARSNSAQPLAAFSLGGTLLPDFGRQARRVIPRGPEDTRPTGPVAASDGDDLVLVWTENWPGDEEEAKEAEVAVERVLLN